MPFESIIITGTSCAGKSTDAEEICKTYSVNGTTFQQVPAVTTREKRDDDLIYKYITVDKFDTLLENNELLTYSEYRGKSYGIIKTDYNKVKAKKVPILVLSAISATNLMKEKNNKYLCFFLDEKDKTLVERLVERSKKDLSKKDIEEFNKQNNYDRTFQDKAHYIINNTDLQSTISLIVKLWKLQYQGGALSQNIIADMIKCGMLLRNADYQMIKGASYDLCLGDEYYYDGRIQTLSDKNPFLTIEPYDYAIVSCKETAWIPRDIIANFGLSVGLFCQGIILSNGPQIDPGFRGTLFCLLFNTSNRAVHLKRGKHYATIEFNKLIGYSEPYEGKYQGKEKIIEYIPENALHGAINELKKEIENLKNESRILQNIYLGVVALMFAIISILLVIN